MLLDTISAVLTGCASLEMPQQLIVTVLQNAHRRSSEPHSDQVCYRASSIGKPWVLQVLNRWYPCPPAFSGSSLMKMTDGIVTQAWAEEILTLCGIQFSAEEEWTAVFDGGVKVVGHSDIVCKKNNDIVVLECKSMAAHLITSFANCPNDDYGYVSQLSFYTTQVRKTNPMANVVGVFLLFDRSLGKFRIVPLIDSVIQAKYQRLENALGRVAAIPQFDLHGLLTTVDVPPPINGKLPTSMKWGRWAKCFYKATTVRGDYELYDPAESIRLIENVVSGLL